MAPLGCRSFQKPSSPMTAIGVSANIGNRGCRPTAALRQRRRQRPDDRAIARKRTPICGGAMRIIAFITDAPTVCDILVHLGEFTAPPRIAPARVPK
jgi:hypothetical protein